MAQFVRQSKFRHIYGQPLKKEQCFDNVRITKGAADGQLCAVNPKWLAVLSDANGSSAFYVIDVNKPGRLEAETPLVSGHKGMVLELQWCPHDDDVIASAGEDCVVKIWRIPSEGLTLNLVEPVVSLTGHQRRVGTLLWHPTAANVLVSAGQEGRIIVWDVSKALGTIVVDLPSYAVSMSFNFIGSKLAVTCKDKFLRVIDIRNKKILQQGQAHEGSRPAVCTYVRDDKIFTTGFTKMSKRCYALWNDSDLSKPVMSDDLDSSNGTMFPYYDHDLGLLFLIGKGDSQIRQFEINNEHPFVHFLTVFGSNETQRGFCYMPKRGANTAINEIARVFKIHNKNWVEVIQFMVPRKSEMFQDDLYPDTVSDQPALTADEWLAGRDAEPILISMREIGNHYGPGKPGPNRILTSPVASSGQDLPSLAFFPAPVVESPSTNGSHASALVQQPASPSPKSPSPPPPQAAAAAAAPVKQEIVQQDSRPFSAAVNIPPDFDFDAVQESIKNLKIVTIKHDSRIQAVEGRYSQSLGDFAEDTTDVVFNERLSKALFEHEQRIQQRYSQIFTEQESRIKLLEERVAQLSPNKDEADQQNVPSSPMIEQL